MCLFTQGQMESVARTAGSLHFAEVATPKFAEVCLLAIISGPPAAGNVESFALQICSSEDICVATPAAGNRLANMCILYHYTVIATLAGSHSSAEKSISRFFTIIQ